MTEFRTFYLYNSVFLPICYAGGIYQSRVCIYITHINKIIRKPLYISYVSSLRPAGARRRCLPAHAS